MPRELQLHPPAPLPLPGVQSDLTAFASAGCASYDAASYTCIPWVWAEQHCRHCPTQPQTTIMQTCPTGAYRHQHQALRYGARTSQVKARARWCPLAWL